MALIVENGTGMATADSYVSVADADAYHTAHGNAGWTGAAKEQALRRATAWIDATFRPRFPGYRLTGRTQALEWPRTHVLDGDGLAVDSASVPQEIERATYEAALREVVTPGALIAPTAASAAWIKSERVGPLEREYGGDGKSGAAVTSIDIIEGYLEPILLATAGWLRRA